MSESGFRSQHVRRDVRRRGGCQRLQAAAMAAAVGVVGLSLVVVAGQPAAAASTVYLSAQSVAATTATLSISGHAAAWWYQQVAPSEGTCTSVQAGTSTASLSELSEGTEHTFKAYSNSGCSTELTDDLTDADFATPGVVLNTDFLIVPEGGSYDHTVRLTAEPAGDVTVTVTRGGSDDSDLTADTDTATTGDQSTLTFSAANWAWPQSVRLSAAEDTDTVPQAGKGDGSYAQGTATFTYTTSSTADSGYSGRTATLTAYEGDNDVCQGTTAVGGSLVTTGGLVDDCNTLLAAKDIVNGTQVQQPVSNWDTGTAIGSWAAVTASAVSGVQRVTALNVSLSLSPANNGNVPNTVGSLAELTILRLVGNGARYRGPLPDGIENLTKLTEIEFYKKRLTGKLPSDIGNLTGLTQLLIDLNDLSGTIPASIGSLTSLTNFSLGSNNFTGPIPPEFGSLTSLTHSWSSDSQFTGHFPGTFNNLTNVSNSSYFDWRNNRIAGCVPTRFAASFGANLNPQRDARGNSVTLPTCSAGIAASQASGETDSQVAVPEGSTVDLHARLWTAPTADVTVTVSSSGDSDGDITADTDTATAGNQTTLTFTSTNWATPQTVRLSAAQDGDATAGSATFTLTSSSSGDTSYASHTATITATEADDDASLALVQTYETSASLKLADHTSWHYRQEFPQGSAHCRAASSASLMPTGLVAATSYRFGAYADAACDVLIDDVSFSTTAAGLAPAAPKWVVVHRGPGYADLEWPTVPGATRYDISIYDVHTAIWTTILSDQAITPDADGLTRYKMTGQPNRKSYAVAVRAKNALGYGGWSTSPIAWAAVDPAPAWHVAAARSRAGDTLSVSWDQCDVALDWCNGGSQVTGYSVRVSSDNGATWTQAKAVTDPTADSRLTIVASGGQDRDTGNRDPASSNDDRWTLVVSDIDHSDTAANPVDDDTLYLVQVGVTNRFGTNWTHSSVKSYPEGKVGPVDSVTLHRGLRFLDVEWPTLAGATGFDLRYSTDGGSNWTSGGTNVSGTTSGGTTTARISIGIANSGTYIVGVRSLPYHQATQWVNSAPASAAIDPAPAWNLTASRSSGTLAVIWDQCDVALDWCSGGSEVTGWAIRLSTDGGATWTRVKDITGPSDSGVSVVAGGGGDRDTANQDPNSTNDDRWTVTLTSNIDDSATYHVSLGITNRMGTNWTNYGPVAPEIE